MAEAAGWEGDWCVDRGFVESAVKALFVLHK